MGIRRSGGDIQPPRPAEAQGWLLTPDCWPKPAASFAVGIRPPVWSSRTGHCCPWHPCWSGIEWYPGSSVLCHGSDVWGMRLRPRWWIENRLMRRDGIRVIAVSSFTAGALFRGRLSSVLPPGLSRCWFDTLVKASGNVRASHPGIQVTTAFRLVDWRNKGLPELMNAIGALDRSDVHLTVCGSGDPPPDLRRHMQQREYCSLRPGLSDGELAAQLADSDLFVLATRTRHGRRPSGEGFGMVLLEAQVAGTPVVAPAYGGARDAYLDQVTGASPTDESEEALVSTLARLLRDPDRLARMGRRAAEWTSEAFAPDNYAPLAVARLL